MARLWYDDTYIGRGLAIGLVFVGMGIGAGFCFKGCYNRESADNRLIEESRIEAEARVKIETQRTRAIEELARQYGDRTSPEEFKKMVEDLKLNQRER